jgi:hypothetical protein
MLCITDLVLQIDDIIKRINFLLLQSCETFFILLLFPWIVLDITVFVENNSLSVSTSSMGSLISLCFRTVR